MHSDQHADIELPPSFRELCPVSTAAYRAHMARGTLYKWIREGRLQAFGGRGYMRIRIGDLFKPITPRSEAAEDTVPGSGAEPLL
jgi:hypothetical protein